MNTTNLQRYHHYQSLGRRGLPADVDAIMLLLSADGSFSATRLADYALSLVNTPAGRRCIEHYLFNAPHLIQRNYAALYFKRRGAGGTHPECLHLLRRAEALGLIDALQAFSV